MCVKKFTESRNYMTGSRLCNSPFHGRRLGSEQVEGSGSGNIRFGSMTTFEIIIVSYRVLIPHYDTRSGR